MEHFVNLAYWYNSRQRQFEKTKTCGVSVFYRALVNISENDNVRAYKNKDTKLKLHKLV
jgi:hypothetical protein